MSWETPPRERDRLPGLKLVMIAVGVLTVFTLAVLVTGLRQSAWRGGFHPTDTVPSEIGEAEIGIVNQRPFALDRRAQDRLQDQRKELESWGWVDRDAGIVHQPIDEAIRDFVREQEPR